MTRATTEAEKTLIHTPGQRVELHLLSIMPEVVYTARINQVFSSVDSVIQLAYDGGSGTLADVLPGMTMYIGSTAGAYDKGMVRIRKAPSTTKIYIGVSSDIDFADNDYLTIVDEFGLWSIDPTVNSSITYIDSEIPYVSQHTYREPVVDMRPMVEVVELTGATVTSLRVAGAVTCLGDAVTAYDWSAPGASATSGMTTNTPTITYDTPGLYRQSCIFTANLVTFTEHRWIYVIDPADPPTSKFILDKCTGDFDTGYWSYEVTMYADADLSSVRDRALTVLYAKDFYGDTIQSIGQIEGFENVIAEGWIAGESIKRSWKDNTVTFTVEGPGFWLDKKTIPATMLTSTTGQPASWTQMQNLTIDKALWHLLHYRTTATAIMDIHLSGDTRYALTLEGPVGSPWEQLKAISGKIFAAPHCDRYGQMYVEIDSQLLPVADRTTFPTVQSLTEVDWQDEVIYDRETVESTSMVELSGSTFDGTNETELKSRAPGNSYGRSGAPFTQDDLVFVSQVQANALAGAIYAHENGEYPYIPITFAGNNRMFDICPRQYAEDTVGASDTLRGIAFTKRLIPRTVMFSYEQETSSLITEIDFEGETIPKTGVAVEIEKTANNTGDTTGDPDISFPTIPSVDLPVIDLPDWYTDTGDLPGLVCRTTDGYAANGPWPIRYGVSAIVSGLNIAGLLSAWVRKATATYKSYVLLDAFFEAGSSPSGPWAPQIDDSIPCAIVPNAGLFADMDEEYITYSWDLKPSLNGGHGILRATFNPPDGFNAGYFYIKMATAGHFLDTDFSVECLDTWSQSGSAGTSAPFALYGKIGAFFTPPARDRFIAVYRMINLVDRGAGYLKFYWTNTCVEGGSGYSCHMGGGAPYRFPSAWMNSTASLAEINSILGTGLTTKNMPYGDPIPNYAYYGNDGEDPVYTPAKDLDYYTSGRKFDIAASHFGIGGTIEGGMDSKLDCSNGWNTEISRITWRPTIAGTEVDLFNTGAYARISVMSMNAYNLCARE